MSSPEQNCHFRRIDYMALQLQSHNWKKHRGKKIQKAIITTRPSLSEAFIPLPSLPAMTPICLVAHLPCGSSKNGSQMWGGSQMLSQRYRAAQRISVPHNIHKYFSVCAHFQLGLTSVFSKGSKADVNSLNHMPLLMCFTMTTRSAEFEFEAIKLHLYFTAVWLVLQ